jgi:hypothetical protein
MFIVTRAVAVLTPSGVKFVEGQCKHGTPDGVHCVTFAPTINMEPLTGFSIQIVQTLGREFGASPW